MTAAFEAGERRRGDNRDREIQRSDAVAWYQRTGHCHGCGNPGNYCTCRRCLCHELHEVGSGLREGALDAFAETVVSDEQEELPL